MEHASHITQWAPFITMRGKSYAYEVLCAPPDFCDVAGYRWGLNVTGLWAEAATQAAYGFETCWTLSRTPKHTLVVLNTNIDEFKERAKADAALTPDQKAFIHNLRPSPIAIGMVAKGAPQELPVRSIDEFYALFKHCVLKNEVFNKPDLQLATPIAYGGMPCPKREPVKHSEEIDWITGLLESTDGLGLSGHIMRDEYVRLMTPSTLSDTLWHAAMQAKNKVINIAIGPDHLERHQWPWYTGYSTPPHFDAAEPTFEPQRDFEYAYGITLRKNSEGARDFCAPLEPEPPAVDTSAQKGILDRIKASLASRRRGR